MDQRQEYNCGWIPIAARKCPLRWGSILGSGCLESIPRRRSVNFARSKGGDSQKFRSGGTIHRAEEHVSVRGHLKRAVHTAAFFMAASAGPFRVPRREYSEAGKVALAK